MWHAVYGGFFILLSFVWGWAVEKERPDIGKPPYHMILQLLAQLPSICVCPRMTVAVHIACRGLYRSADCNCWSGCGIFLSQIARACSFILA